MYHGREEGSVLGMGASVSNTYVLHIPDQGMLLLFSKVPNWVAFLCQVRNEKVEKVWRPMGSSRETGNWQLKTDFFPGVIKHSLVADQQRK